MIIFSKDLFIYLRQREKGRIEGENSQADSPQRGPDAGLNLMIHA